jgi:hypothetical protein
MARRWITYDWVRVAMGVVGFVSAVRAISVPFPVSDLAAKVSHSSQRVA